MRTARSLTISCSICQGACVARISTSQTLFAGGKNRLCNFQSDKLFCMLQPALMIVCDVIMRHVLSVWREKHGMAACALVRFRSCLWIELLIFKFREKNGGSCFEGHLYSVGEGVKRGRRMSLKTNMKCTVPLLSKFIPLKELMPPTAGVVQDIAKITKRIYMPTNRGRRYQYWPGIWETSSARTRKVSPNHPSLLASIRKNSHRTRRLKKISNKNAIQ